jgi:hypothetical protein
MTEDKPGGCGGECLRRSFGFTMSKHTPTGATPFVNVSIRWELCDECRTLARLARPECFATVTLEALLVEVLTRAVTT